MTATYVTADLDFSVEVDGAEMSGRLSGQGRRLDLEVSDPLLMGGSGTGPARALAEQLAHQGLELGVHTDRPLVTLGVQRTSILQRWVTGSKHIRVESAGAAFRLLRLRRGESKHASLAPSSTPLPLAPTFMRRPRHPTTTHDPDRGGYPRLVATPDSHYPDSPRQVVYLDQLTTLGSAEDADMRIPGLLPHHAEVHWREDDEFELRPVEGSDVRVHGAPVTTGAVLRTGSRIDLGERTLVFVREEYADHGRPFGGRVGGELGHQKPQPPRTAM